MVQEDIFVSVVNADTGYYEFRVTIYPAFSEGEKDALDLEMHPVVAFEYRRDENGLYPTPIQAADCTDEPRKGDTGTVTVTLKVVDDPYDIKVALMTPDGYVYMFPDQMAQFSDVFDVLARVHKEESRVLNLVKPMTDLKSFVEAFQEAHRSHVCLGDRVKKKYTEVIQQGCTIPRKNQNAPIGTLASPVVAKLKRKRGRPPKQHGAIYFEGI